MNIVVVVVRETEVSSVAKFPPFSSVGAKAEEGGDETTSGGDLCHDLLCVNPPAQVARDARRGRKSLRFQSVSSECFRECIGWLPFLARPHVQRKVRFWSLSLKGKKPFLILRVLHMHEDRNKFVPHSRICQTLVSNNNLRQNGYCCRTAVTVALPLLFLNCTSKVPLTPLGESHPPHPGYTSSSS